MQAKLTVTKLLLLSPVFAHSRTQEDLLSDVVPSNVQVLEEFVFHIFQNDLPSGMYSQAKALMGRANM